MTTATANEMKPVGTMLIANDSFQKKLGVVVAHKSDRWGTRHIVECADQTEHVCHVDDALSPPDKIGWKVATPDEIARCLRYMAHTAE